MPTFGIVKWRLLELLHPCTLSGENHLIAATHRFVNIQNCNVLIVNSAEWR